MGAGLHEWGTKKARKAARRDEKSEEATSHKRRKLHRADSASSVGLVKSRSSSISSPAAGPGSAAVVPEFKREVVNHGVLPASLADL